MKMRRTLSLVLAMAILLSLAIPAFATEEENTALIMSDAGIEMIKGFEGFSVVPYWDVNQWTVGYGTRCPSDKVDYYKEHGITEGVKRSFLNVNVVESILPAEIDGLSWIAVNINGSVIHVEVSEGTI